jgi:leader peptidase (prepilin peptidase)/N-methyltransferase
MIGAFLGWPGVLFTMFVGSILGAIGGVAFALSGAVSVPPEAEIPAAIAEVIGVRRGDPPPTGEAGDEVSLMRTEVPFGPFLALAAACYALFQPQLLHWYLSR